MDPSSLLLRLQRGESAAEISSEVQSVLAAGVPRDPSIDHVHLLATLLTRDSRLSSKSQQDFVASATEMINRIPPADLRRTDDLIFDLANTAAVPEAGIVFELLSPILARLNTADGSGQSFREKVLERLCAEPWPRGCAVSIAGILKDFCITSEEKAKLQHRVLDHAEHVSNPYDIPPLIHHVLQLVDGVKNVGRMIARIAALFDSLDKEVRLHVF